MSVKQQMDEIKAAMIDEGCVCIAARIKDEALALVMRDFENVAQQLLEADYSKRDANALFKIVSASLLMRKVLNPEDNDLAVGIAAMAITRRVLELREEKRAEKEVVA